jgi:Cys-tRNA(Pro)/Cys-tRNA(Cys) deacylase
MIRFFVLFTQFFCKTRMKNYVKTIKTNAARILDKYNISYELISYEVDENDLSAIHVAEQLNEPIDRVFKTLILRGDKQGIFVCIIPGAAEVELKKTAKETMNKNCEMVAMKELLPLTGYIRGGCSPIGMKKNFPTFIHQTCRYFPYIYISAGIRGLQLKLAPNDLIKVTNATVADLID